MSTVSIPPVTARDGQPCANCRAPLAGDQRYCLQCGTRRADAPGTSLESLVAASAPGIAQTPGVAIVAGTGQVQLAPAPGAVTPYPVAYGGGAGYGGPPERPRGAAGWIRSNGPFLSLGSLAVGVLIVGLLLGHWSASDSAAPQPTTTKIEVSIPGGLGTASAAPAAASTDASTDTSSDASATKDSSAASNTPAATPAPAPANAVKANNLTPAEIDKAAKKGKTIVTTGKTVPKDNKPAGGGSAVDDIG